MRSLPGHAEESYFIEIAMETKIIDLRNSEVQEIQGKISEKYNISHPRQMEIGSRKQEV